MCDMISYSEKSANLFHIPFYHCLYSLRLHITMSSGGKTGQECKCVRWPTKSRLYGADKRYFVDVHNDLLASWGSYHMASKEGQLLPCSKRNMEARVTVFTRIRSPSQCTWEHCAIICQEGTWEKNFWVVGSDLRAYSFQSEWVVSRQWVWLTRTFQ